MGGKVVVMSQADYAAWMANQGETATHMSMEQAGARLFNKIGCANCHGSVDTPRAPSLYGIYGRTERYSNAPTGKIDDEAVRSAILRPYDRLVQGYDESMPAYQGQISEDDVLNLLAYIRSMGASTKPTPAGSTYRGAVTTAGHQDTPTTLAVGSLQSRTETPDATPTVRKAEPSVGAIASRGGNQ
jgi:cytochrome c oxidase subunit 2